jgi:hypothetical protein
MIITDKTGKEIRKDYQIAYLSDGINNVCTVSASSIAHAKRMVIRKNPNSEIIKVVLKNNNGKK